eukprot:Hpha_TRINITY_DN25971_c0_g1::TRINITY_DN25971_c0_g1_i1::g.185360::m.185360
MWEWIILRRGIVRSLMRLSAELKTRCGAAPQMSPFLFPPSAPRSQNERGSTPASFAPRPPSSLPRTPTPTLPSQAAVTATKFAVQAPAKPVANADALLAAYGDHTAAHEEVAKRRRREYVATRERLWRGGNGATDPWVKGNRLDSEGASVLLLLVRMCAGSLEDTFDARELLRLRCARMKRPACMAAELTGADLEPPLPPETADQAAHWACAYDGTTAVLQRSARTLSSALRFLNASSYRTVVIDAARKVISELWAEAEVPMDAYFNADAPRASAPPSVDAVGSGMLPAAMPGPKVPALWYAAQSPPTVGVDWASYMRPAEPPTPESSRIPQTARPPPSAASATRWRETRRSLSSGPMPPTWTLRDPEAAYQRDQRNKRAHRAHATPTPEPLEQLTGAALTAAVERDAAEHAHVRRPTDSSFCRTTDTPDVDQVVRLLSEKAKADAEEAKEEKEPKTAEGGAGEDAGVEIGSDLAAEPSATIWNRVQEIREKRRVWYRAMTLGEKERFIVFNKVEIALHRLNVLNNLRRVAGFVAVRIIDQRVAAQGGVIGPRLQALRDNYHNKIRECGSRRVQIALDRARNFTTVRFLDMGRYAAKEDKAPQRLPLGLPSPKPPSLPSAFIRGGVRKGLTAARGQTYCLPQGMQVIRPRS